MTLRRSSWALGLVSFVGLLAIWQAAVSAGLIGAYYVSSPIAVGEAFVAMLREGTIQRHFTASAISFLIAFAIATSAGVALGMAAGMFRTVERTLDPFVWFLYSTPAIALYPLFVAWLGFGRPTSVATAVMFALTPIYANTLTGVKNVSPQLMRMAHSFGARPMDLFVRIALPASVPLIVGGMQLGVGRALAGVLVAELFGANAGLGFSIAYNAQYMRTTKMMVFILLVIVCGLVLTRAMAAVSAMSDRWRT
ncbi:ABC transporter permease [Acuticoccus mangrovi]|uniref:ABC transporter permease n=1 Tax=Acuticoccus mangrovi TaxID=2796142 RepID=A0A934MH05_9HYPH|nr:ABC transporter permease [Acuticoccus mangrovi]MBJ3775556.1 ABC transporter permease [Acuticoccus mangrovi]